MRLKFVPPVDIPHLGGPPGPLHFNAAGTKTGCVFIGYDLYYTYLDLLLNFVLDPRTSSL